MNRRGFFLTAVAAAFAPTMAKVAQPEVLDLTAVRTAGEFILPPGEYTEGWMACEMGVGKTMRMKFVIDGLSEYAGQVFEDVVREAT